MVIVEVDSVSVHSVCAVLVATGLVVAAAVGLAVAVGFTVAIGVAVAFVVDVLQPTAAKRNMPANSIIMIGLNLSFMYFLPPVRNRLYCIDVSASSKCSMNFRTHSCLIVK
ncbi:hypothetical protein SDC9_138871 [bioreactor metagenome]|uniref:Uncharacterized protein n=1 Tax=bioreactor metagenome TaxID=1076179 RepID=A0A645DQX9_9ZZZZ